MISLAQIANLASVHAECKFIDTQKMVGYSTGLLERCEKDLARVLEAQKMRRNTEQASSATFVRPPKACPKPQAVPGDFTGLWGPHEVIPLSYRRDTACVKTPYSRFYKKLTEKWPDAVGIGFPKCGTSTLSFLDCHSRSPRDNFIFNNNITYIT